MKSETNHAENFSLKSFLFENPTSLDNNISQFYNWISNDMQSMSFLYKRIIEGPMDREVKVRENGELRKMLMFGSNNYLGLATHPKVKESILESMKTHGYGLGGPPLLNGYSSLHHKLENKISQLKKSEDCLLTASGYMANLTWVDALVSDENYVFFDAYNHASLHYGLSSKKCKQIPFRHNNLEDLEKKLKFYTKAKNKFLVIEGIYSMDGDMCTLTGLEYLVKKYGLKLVIDDAHGTGVVGNNGSGVSSFFKDHNSIFLHIGTFSKALASIGGFIAGDKKTITYLRYMGNQYMFSASAPATIVGGVLGALTVMESEPELQNQLMRNVDYCINAFKEKGIDTSTDSAIIPIHLKKKRQAKHINHSLHKQGVFTNSVEYPAVPEDKERIRISIMANHTQNDIDYLVNTLSAEYNKK